MNPPPPIPSVQSPTIACAAPRSPLTPNRLSMSSRGNRITALTPTARWLVGGFGRSPTERARKEFTPSAATTTRARSSSSPARTPTTVAAPSGPASVSSESTRTPGIRNAPASSALPASQTSNLARSTVTALTGSAVSLDYSADGPAEPVNAVTVLRAKFDVWLAGKAEEAGAFLMPGVRVDSLLTEPGPDGATTVVGVRAGDDELRARVVVAADGGNAFLARSD